MSRSKLLYLTGLSGVGKTAVARSLEKSVAPLQHYSIGEGIARRMGSPPLLADHATRTQIFEELIDEILTLRANSNVIVDGHSIVAESYGGSAIPLAPWLLGKLAFDAIILLTLEPALLLERISRDTKQRPPLNANNAQLLQSLQITIAATYASTCGCPLFIMDADHSVSNLTVSAIDILKRVGAELVTR